MSEKSAKKASASNELATSNNGVKVFDPGVMSVDELVNALNNFDESEAVEITVEYLKLEPGQAMRAYAVEEAEVPDMNDKTKMVKAYKMLCEDGNYRYAANAVVVSTLEQYPLLTPVKITCTGERKNKGGSFTYATYSIKRLA